MSELAAQTLIGNRLTAHYSSAPCAAAPEADVLIEIIFSAQAPSAPHPRRLHVGLEPLHGVGLREIWRSAGTIRTGAEGAIRYSEDEQYLIGIIELDEREYADIGATAAAAYAQIRRFQTVSSKPHLLRMWNYFDAITDGEGDAERYQMFCVGRAEGLGNHQFGALPAATAIGRRDGSPMLQVYWLAAKNPGHPIENPRQISAYHYPRQYGRVSPRFARAMLNANGELLISGTASVVGHATHHDGDVAAQLRETLLNLDTLLQQAHARNPACPAHFSGKALLKVYLRQPQACAAVVAQLCQRLTADTSLLVLAADICREDLLIEIDGLHT
jgi:chorismate lyase / 3-hydroxybenzoate synthase